MDKRRNTFIIMLVLASALSVAAIAEFMHVSKIELAKTEKVRGRVTAAAVTQRVIRGIKYNRTETIFWFRLHNVAENFAIHQPHDAYSDLERNVREGDWLIVYFKGSSAFYNTHVYQVEKKEK